MQLKVVKNVQDIWMIVMEWGMMKMVRFCNCGKDMFICQECGRDLCSYGCDQKLIVGMSAVEYVEGKGNVCKTCLSKHYLKDGEKYVRVEMIKTKIGLKGNPAYDLMM